MKSKDASINLPILKLFVVNMIKKNNNNFYAIAND